MDKKKVYVPEPLNLEEVALPEEVLALSERIAKNVHDVWAENRMKEGWSYGEERNDAEKKHPCLVEYEDLPEEEKEYDRNTALSSLKMVYALGFEIIKKG